MDFDAADYERRLQRWAALDLPMFRIEDWPGAWQGSASGALLSTSKGAATNARNPALASCCGKGLRISAMSGS